LGSGLEVITTDIPNLPEDCTGLFRARDSDHFMSLLKDRLYSGNRRERIDYRAVKLPRWQDRLQPIVDELIENIACGDEVRDWRPLSQIDF